nr:MAG TPA: hypothetical protein [Caudoviricetes sp.]
MLTNLITLFPIFLFSLSSILNPFFLRTLTSQLFPNRKSKIIIPFLSNFLHQFKI